MKKLLSLIDALSIWSGKAASWLILLVVGFIIYEILMRYVFHLPTLWVSESMVFGAGLTYVLGSAWALQDNRHVKIDLIYGRLTPRQRAVMHLTVVEGMSDSEIGTVMGIDAGSVRSHRRRARERLRQVLAGPPAEGR